MDIRFLGNSEAGEVLSFYRGIDIQSIDWAQKSFTSYDDFMSWWNENFDGPPVFVTMIRTIQVSANKVFLGNIEVAYPNINSFDGLKREFRI